MTLTRSSALVLLSLVGLTAPIVTTAAEPIFHTRSYNAFTQIFGRPEFFAGAMREKGSTEVRSTINIVSFAERDVAGNEQMELDGETYHLDWHLDHVVTGRWEVGARVPFLRHSSGFLDATVDNFHDLIGAPDGDRDSQPRNELRFFYNVGNQIPFNIDDSSQGIGDVQLRSRYLLTRPSSTGRHLALHGGVKLPTGDDKDLRGSGATDYSLGIGYSDPVSLSHLRTTLSAHAGVLFLGTGDVLGDIQEDTVPFAGLQLSIAATDRISFLAGIQGAGSYYDSDLDILGDTTVQLSFGLNFRFPQSGWDWRFGIVEDGLSEVMPDFALHMEVSKRFGN